LVKFNSLTIDEARPNRGEVRQGSERPGSPIRYYILSDLGIHFSGIIHTKFILS